MDNKRKKEVLARFGKQLNALRKNSDLSLRELAARCDVDHSDIKKYEDGEKDLRLLTMVELAIGLGVDPKELLNFDTDFLKKE
jgi:transcriptional regulator with XRE-family HTH domain